MKQSFRSFALLVLTVVLTALCLPAKAATVSSQSQLNWGAFLSSDGVPFLYSWQGLVRIDYSPGGDSIVIQKVDQTVQVFGAGRDGNPLSLVASISIDVLENGSNKVATIYVTDAGSYLYDPSNLLFGGLTYPNLRVKNPTFHANMVIQAQDGFGWYQRSWDFRPETSAGHVEVHSATRASNYQRAGTQKSTYFTKSDATYGFLQIVGRDLWLIKTNGTGSGMVEVHSATSASNYQNGVHYATYFTLADANDGTVQMVGADLVLIKLRHTSSGRIEVHTATRASNYRSGFHFATYFPVTDANNGIFQMDGWDLWYEKLRNTGTGHVEVHSATRASNYQGASVHSTTWFNLNDPFYGVFQVVAGDLWFVKQRSTGSGQVEVHSATRASSYQQAGTQSGTWFTLDDADHGYFQVVGPDLWLIRTR